MTAPPPERGTLRSLCAVARSGAQAVTLHPLRSVATVGCLVAIVLPYVVGLGVSAGLRDELEDALAGSGDLHVSAARYGRPAPFPVAAAARIAEIPGVREVTPRVVGEVQLGARRESALVVGVPAESVPSRIAAVEGRLFAPGAPGEIVVGAQLARRLGLAPGDRLPPFYRNERGERVVTVVGVFREQSPLFHADLMFTSLETAWTLFAEEGTATDLVVTCAPGYAEPVARRIGSLATLGGEGAPLRPRVTLREDLRAALLRRVLDRETLFQLPFVLAFAVGIPLVAVTSGAGLRERRREAALLVAVGWSPEALLWRSAVESLVLTAFGVSLAILLACAWLGPLDGAGLAPVLIPGADRVPVFPVPFRLAGLPVLLGAIVALVLVATGSLWSTYRVSGASPSEVVE